MAIHGIVFGHAAMVIGVVDFFSLTATEILGVVFHCGTLVVGIVVFCRTTPLLVICCTTTAMHSKHTNQPKEGCTAKICLMAMMENGSVGSNDGKDASATMAMMPVQRGHWHGPNNGKEASNRDNVLDNNQPAQQKEERVHKRSGVEEIMHS